MSAWWAVAEGTYADSRLPGRPVLEGHPGPQGLAQLEILYLCPTRRSWAQGRLSAWASGVSIVVPSTLLGLPIRDVSPQVRIAGITTYCSCNRVRCVEGRSISPTN